MTGCRNGGGGGEGVTGHCLQHVTTGGHQDGLRKSTVIIDFMLRYGGDEEMMDFMNNIPIDVNTKSTEEVDGRGGDAHSLQTPEILKNELVKLLQLVING